MTGIVPVVTVGNGTFDFGQGWQASYDEGSDIFLLRATADLNHSVATWPDGRSSHQAGSISGIMSVDGLPMVGVYRMGGGMDLMAVDPRTGVATLTASVPWTVDGRFSGTANLLAFFNGTTLFAMRPDDGSTYVLASTDDGTDWAGQFGTAVYYPVWASFGPSSGRWVLVRFDPSRPSQEDWFTPSTETDRFVLSVGADVHIAVTASEGGDRSTVYRLAASRCGECNPGPNPVVLCSGGAPFLWKASTAVCVPDGWIPANLPSFNNTRQFALVRSSHPSVLESIRFYTLGRPWGPDVREDMVQELERRNATFLDNGIASRLTCWEPAAMAGGTGWHACLRLTTLGGDYTLQVWMCVRGDRAWAGELMSVTPPPKDDQAAMAVVLATMRFGEAGCGCSFDPPPNGLLAPCRP